SAANLETMRTVSFSPLIAKLAGKLPVPEPIAAGSIALTADPVSRSLAAMRSGDAARAREALLGSTPLDAALVPQAIQLLGRDEVMRASVESLVPVAARHVGQLIDALLDPGTEFAVRRRLPGVLAAVPTSRAVEGLSRGLADGRFEVRYRCGRALARMLERESSLQVDRGTILDA